MPEKARYIFSFVQGLEFLKWMYVFLLQQSSIIVMKGADSSSKRNSRGRDEPSCYFGIAKKVFFSVGSRRPASRVVPIMLLIYNYLYI